MKHTDLHDTDTQLFEQMNQPRSHLTAALTIAVSEVCRLYSVDDSAVLREWDIETAQCLNSIPRTNSESNAASHAMALL